MRARSLWAGALAAILLAPAVQAADNMQEDGCAFRPPPPALLQSAYPPVSFVRQSENRAIESAQLRKGVRVEIAHSQCVDFIAREITFVVARDQPGPRDDKGWLDFARVEMGRLKLATDAPDLRELQQFLLRARELAQRDGARSQCKDGSSAPAGQCAWESTGGYVVRIRKDRANVRISATEYVSG